MKRHCYGFEGGEQLAKMGATWFVSYHYFLSKDSSHENWKSVGTAKMRIKMFERTKEHHRSWLKEVLRMNDTNLAKATIGLPPEQTKQMARELLG